MSHIETYSEHCATLAYTTEPYSEPELSSKVWLTCKMIRHIQRPGIVRTLCKHFQRCLGTFRDIDTYWFPFTGVELGGGGKLSLPFFENKEKCSDFWKNNLDCVHLWVNFSVTVTRHYILCCIWEPTSKNLPKSQLDIGMSILQTSIVRLMKHT